jgi:ABC-2 type transport system permease protein
MIASFKAELLKLGKRPTTWVLLAVSLALTELFAYALPYVSYLTGDQSRTTEGLSAGAVLNGLLPGQLVPNAIGGFPVFTGAMALTFGALAVGGEYGWGTLKTILTQGPSRMAVFAGKLAAVGAALAVAVLVIFGVGALSTAGIGLAESQPLHWPGAAALAEGVGSAWLILAMWAAFGALFAFAFRSVALPIGLGVIWIIAIENLVSSVADNLLTSLQGLRDVLPGANAGSLVWTLAKATGDPGSLAPGVNDAVSGPRAVLTLTAYLVVFVLAGALAMRRRDVT